MQNSSRKIAFVVPTFSGHAPSDQLLTLCRESVKGIGKFFAVVEPASIRDGALRAMPRGPFLKYAEGWRSALEWGAEAIVLLHHDTVVTSPGNLQRLVEHVLEKEFAFAGPRDGCTCVRSRPEGMYFLNTSLVIANPSVVGP